MGVWGVVLVVCVCVSESGVLFSVGVCVCVCVCDLLICSQALLTSYREGAFRYDTKGGRPLLRCVFL